MNHVIITVLTILFLMTGFCSSAQEQSKADSLIASVVKPEHSPRKASIYSAIMPGLGQIYNKKYWKVPLIYGGFIGFAYAIDWNNDLYITYRQAFSDIIDNDPNTNSFMDLDIEGHWDFENASQVQQFSNRLKNAKDASRRNRDLVIIATAAFYAINIIDATVDAHFFNFDISDDLTINWVPGPLYCMNQPLPGIHVSIKF